MAGADAAAGPAGRGPSARRLSLPAIALVIAAGTAIKLILAFTLTGPAYDLASYRVAADALAADGLHMYATPEVEGRWPYPPLALAWVALAVRLEASLGIPLHGLVNLPAIAGDVAVCLLLLPLMRRAGLSGRAQLAAVALVAAGPLYLLISGFHGQLDPAAFALAVAALAAWERGGPRRALIAGLLLGAGIAIKQPAGLLLIALLPAATGTRERLTLVAAAGAPPALLLAPFVAAEPRETLAALWYAGVIGAGGISLAVQPNWIANALTGADHGRSAAARALIDHGPMVTALAFAVVLLVLWRRRPEPREGAVTATLGLYATAAGFGSQYGTWLPPFLLATGRLWWTAAMQVVVAGPAILVHAGPWDTNVVVPLYVVPTLAFWIACVVLVVARLRAPPHTG